MISSENNILDLKDFLNVCKDGMLILNKNFKVEFSNRVMGSLLFLGNEEITGKDFRDLIFCHVDIEDRIKIKWALETKDNSNIEVYFKERNKWIDMCIYTLEDFKYAITIRDISEKKTIELALKESKVRASSLVVELQRINEIKDDFISTLSHELRNLLATISMGLELMEHVESGSEVDLETRQIVKRQTGQLISLVDDLLNVNKLGKNKVKLSKKNVDINSIIKETAEDYNYNFEEEGIKLKKELYKEPIYMDLDPNRFKQVIGNLLSNALKFTMKDGEVKLKVYKDKDGENIIVQVKDTGIGIDPELLPQLFQPFIQIDNSMARQIGGLGLGLSIVKGIIDLHGGTIKVESEGLGKGTTFTIRLPMESN